MTPQFIMYLFLRVFPVQMDMDIQEEKEQRWVLNLQIILN